jgi:hypothetical protein
MLLLRLNHSAIYATHPLLRMPSHLPVSSPHCIQCFSPASLFFCLSYHPTSFLSSYTFLVYKQPVSLPTSLTMCYQVVERFSVCRCQYYKHAIDPCSAYGQRGHMVQEKTVLVGYACSIHSHHRSEVTYNTGVLPDSGYESDTYAPASLR